MIKPFFVILLCLRVGSYQIMLNSLSKENLQSYSVEVVHTSSRQIVKIGSEKTIQLLNVPDSYQYLDYSSGHSCLEAIFNYYQFPTNAAPYREEFFIDSSDFDEYNFTSPDKLIKAAQRKLSKETNEDRRKAFGFLLQENMEASTLQRSLNQQIPVILLITKQNNRSPPYVVAIGYDQNNYYFQDPFKMGSIGYLPKNELSQHWQAYIQSQNRWASQVGILITFNNGRKRQTVPTVRPMP